MSQQLRVKECMIQLERKVEISIIDYISIQNSDSVIILINVKDRIKWHKNKPFIIKLSKQVGKYLKYISLQSNIKQVAKHCVFPVEIEDVVVKRKNGKTTLIYLIDECIKDSVLNWYRSKFKMSETLLKKYYAVDNIEIEGINPDLYFYYGKQMLSKVHMG